MVVVRRSVLEVEPTGDVSPLAPFTLLYDLDFDQFSISSHRVTDTFNATHERAHVAVE